MYKFILESRELILTRKEAALVTLALAAYQLTPTGASNHQEKPLFNCSLPYFGPFVINFSAMACWSSGMIRASGARGPGFDSRTGPTGIFESYHMLRSTINSNGSEKFVRSRGWFRSTDLWVMGPARFLCATLLRATRQK